MPSQNPFTGQQAPVAMAMMAPDLAQDQAALLRQQQLAQLLREQSLQPTGPTEMVSGWAVKRSPVEALAKLGQALAGSWMQGENDRKQAALAQALGQRMDQSLDSLFGIAPQGAIPSATGQQTPPASVDASSGVPSGTPAPPQGPSPQIPQGPVQPGMPPSIPGFSAPTVRQLTPQQQAALNVTKWAYRNGQTELGNRIIANFAELTPEQKNMIAMGQDPLEMGRLAIAEARKKGIIELQPGTTALDLATGQERFHPKLGEGIAYQNGQAYAVPGYSAANAEIAGRSAGAVANAQAQNKPITVPTAGGPIMTTEGAVINQVGNGGGVPGNNWGNIRPPGATSGFQRFGSPEEGLAAIDRNLQAYGQKGINTLSGVINRWSPPSENDTKGLIASAASRLGIKPDQQIDLGNPVTRQAIATAIMLQEHGPGKVFAPPSPAQGQSVPGIALKGRDLPESAVKEQQAILDKIGTSGGINADLAALEKQIDSGELKLGPMKNLSSQVKNYVGASDDASRNYASFRATLEKMRNDSLRLNNGVQTEGDAKRAWDELLTGINDKNLVKQRLQEIQRINERGANLQKLQVDVMRKNFGAPPLDTGKAFIQPPAVGISAKPKTIEDLLKQYGG